MCVGSHSFELFKGLVELINILLKPFSLIFHGRLFSPTVYFLIFSCVFTRWQEGLSAALSCGNTVTCGLLPTEGIMSLVIVHPLLFCCHPLNAGWYCYLDFFYRKLLGCPFSLRDLLWFQKALQVESKAPHIASYLDADISKHKFFCLSFCSPPMGILEHFPTSWCCNHQLRTLS